MSPEIIMGIIAVAPVAVLTLTRANAATAFLALCLGSVLGTFVATDTVNLMRGYVAPDSRVTESVVSLILLWLPVVLVAIFMAHTVSAKQRLINLLPSIAVGLLGLLLTVPFLTPMTRADVMASDAWDQLKTYEAAIVAAGTIISLVLLRMRNKHEEKHGKHH